MITALLLAVGLAWAETAPVGSLEAAYQKEYAYLEAERAELAQRTAELEADAAERVRRADAELAALQESLVSTARRADRAEDEFDLLEREASARDDADAVLTSTLQQGADTLGLTVDPDHAVAVGAVFTSLTTRLATQNAVGWEDGRFFLPGGQEVAGRLFRFGQVGAWGVAPEGAGALAPAGEGRLQLRASFGQDTASALAAGAPPSLALHLFEPERGAEEAEKESGLRALLRESGTMGQLLFGLGIVSATLVVIRGLLLVAGLRGGQRLAAAVTRLVETGKLDEARRFVERRGGPLARVLRGILAAAERPKPELERVVDEAILRETPGIDRFASALVVITAGAPLLGLLGTVTGMIATFNVITEHGTGNPKLMSAGIAEALVCTAFGLAVAIPTLLAGNVLASLGDGIKNNLDRASLSLLNAIEARHD